MKTNRSKTRTAKIPRKVSATSLENAALYYLGRYATSSENLRQVLLRRVARAAKHHDTDEEACAVMIDELILRYVSNGLLDDTAYARAQCASLNRRGKSVRAIRGWLRQKGLGPDIIEKTLKVLGEEIVEPDLAAAIAYARRRRFGPYRMNTIAPETRDKELAALARSGFSYALARRIVEATDVDELENAL